MSNPTPATTRQQLGEWFTTQLGDGVTVIDHPTMPDDPEDRITAILLIVRQTIEPAPVLGSYLETHQVWVLDPHVERAMSEEQLDRSLDQVLRAISAPEVSWLGFVKAERDTFADEYPAYVVTVTITSTTTE